MELSIIEWLMLGGGLALIVLNGIVLFRVFWLKADQSAVHKAIEDFRFNQQTYWMNTQKSFNEDFTTLRENLLLQIAKFNEQTLKELLAFQNNLSSEMYKNFDHLIKRVNEELNKINERVEYRLNEGFAKTNQTFNQIVARLSKIDEAQRKIEELSTNIISLEDILTDKKARGTFGEVQLNHILATVFGEHNPKVYETQKVLSNGKVVDAILHTPKPLGSIAIDSKFPLENYRIMVSLDVDEMTRRQAERQFKQDIRQHIDDIKNKYILPNETASSAIMFIPAEAVFAEINAYHQDLIEYAQRNNVWMASPTTLMFLLTTVQIILQNIERDKYASIIQKELNLLSEEFRRYRERWNKLSQNIERVSQNVKELHVTSDKIERRFQSISQVEFQTYDDQRLLEHDDKKED
ncbi:MAG TPA: DNA recombination protein RmuC [Haloplasmataceae bacterium]